MVDWLGIEIEVSLQLYVDNEAAPHIAENPNYHEKTKQIGADHHLIKEKVVANIIYSLVQSEQQLADMLKKPLSKSTFQDLLGKLSMKDIHVPLEGESRK